MRKRDSSVSTESSGTDAVAHFLCSISLGDYGVNKAFRELDFVNVGTTSLASGMKLSILDMYRIPFLVTPVSLPTYVCVKYNVL